MSANHICRHASCSPNASTKNNFCTYNFSRVFKITNRAVFHMIMMFFVKTIWLDKKFVKIRKNEICFCCRIIGWAYSLYRIHHMVSRIFCNCESTNFQETEFGYLFLCTINVNLYLMWTTNFTKHEFLFIYFLSIFTR